MNQYQLDQLHVDVSMEFRNPFAKIGSNGLTNLKSFIAGATKYTSELLSKVDTTHPNGLYNRADDIPGAIAAKKVVYSDWGYLTVFAPSYMKEGVQMLELGKALEEALDHCVLIDTSAPLEARAIMNGYLGNPKRLQDPMLIDIKEYEKTSIQILEAGIDRVNSKMNKLISSSTTSSTREYRKLYGRTNDFYATNEIAAKINAHYVKLTGRLLDYMREVGEANKAANDLILYLEKHPEVSIGSDVAGYLVNTMHRLAKVTSWYSSVLYNTQYFLKAMSDTNEKIRFILSS